MKKINLAISILIRDICIIMVSFVWANYYVRSFALALVISLTITALAEALIQLISAKRGKKYALTSAENKKIESISNAMIFAPYEQVISFYYNILKTKYCSVKKKDCIVVEYKGKKVTVVPLYSINGVPLNSLTEAIQIATRNNTNKLFVLGNYYMPECVTLASNITSIEVCLLDARDVYTTLLKPNNYYPTWSVDVSKPKLTSKDILAVVFNRTRAKGYLICGLILIFSSLFTPYNLYYVISSTILLFMAMYSYFNTTYRQDNKKDLL